MRIALLILLLGLVSCRSPHLGDSAAEVASTLANAKAQELYGCKPFAVADFAVSDLDGVLWCDAVAGYWQGDLIATVMLETDLQPRSVEIGQLSSLRQIKPTVEVTPEDGRRLLREVRMQLNKDDDE